MDQTNPNTIRELLDRHGAALVLYARSCCAGNGSGDHLPEDLVQEALVALWRQADLPERPVAWLYRVVRNRAIDARRAKRRRHDHESRAATHVQEAWFASPVESGLLAEEVSAALEELPPEQRETIVARLWSDLTFEEIAELTETSTSTAHRRYVEGLANLRERMNSPCQNETQANP